jgi:hypothetical protein
MLQHQQPNRDQREHIHYRMNLFATADNQIKANVRNEAPEYSLGDRKGQGDEDYSQKCRQTFLNFPKSIWLTLLNIDAPTRTSTGAVAYAEPSRERREKEARQKAERGKHRGQPVRPPLLMPAMLSM